MRVDEDDLYDYDNDSFDEEAAIAEVVSSLKPEKVSEAQAEAELDKVDWDIDVAIANLRKRLVKPKKPAPAPAPAAPKGKLTPLQMLAQRRNNNSNRPNNDDNDDNDESTKEQKRPSLAELAAARRAPSKEPEEQKLSALEKLRLRKLQKPSPHSASPSPPPDGKNSASKAPADSAPPGSAAPSKAPPKQVWRPSISYTVPPIPDGLGKPSVFGAIIGVTQARKHTFDRNTNSLATAKNAASEFQKPSPDDKVLNAQSAAFTKPAAKPAASQPAKQPAAKSAAATQPAAKSATAQPAAEPLKPKNEPESKQAGKSLAAMQASAAAKSGPSGLLSKLSSLELKPSCSFVVIGHVDAGKSTLMGRLLLDTGALNPKLVQKYEHESAKLGKQSFWLAWAMDATSEERERGVTVDIGEASFSTKATNFTVLDAPGHKDYVPNMIAGVTQADLAVLVVDSDTNAFESGFSLDGQTKEHAVLARSLSIDKIVVAVNKMDTQGWDESRFEEICAQLTEFLAKRVGFPPQQIVYVPTSGIKGVNVVHKSSEPAWYTGPSLVEALDEFASSRADQSSKSTQPLRYIVSNAFTEPFKSTVSVTGRVLSGTVENNDALEVVNSREPLHVKSVGGQNDNNNNDRDFLVAGQQGEMKLALDRAGDESVQNVAAGDVIAGYGADLVSTQQFTAKIRLFDLPKPVLPGTPLAFHMGRVEDTAKIVSILGSLDPKQKSKKLRHLGKGAAARVVVQLSKPTVLATPDVCKELGRFVLRLNGATIGGGVVEELN